MEGEPLGLRVPEPLRVEAGLGEGESVPEREAVAHALGEADCVPHSVGEGLSEGDCDAVNERLSVGLALPVCVALGAALALGALALGEALPRLALACADGEAEGDVLREGQAEAVPLGALEGVPPLVAVDRYL